MSYYDGIASGYNELHGEEQRKKLAIIKEKLRAGKKDRLLDVGCGTGIAFEFFDCIKAGVDPALELLKQSKDSTVQGIAEHLPFKDKSFDYVISVTAIHNFEDIQEGLAEIRRVGRKHFAFSVLKNSAKAGEIDWFVRAMFPVSEIVEEEKDLIYFI